MLVFLTQASTGDKFLVNLDHVSSAGYDPVTKRTCIGYTDSGDLSFVKETLGEIYAMQFGIENSFLRS